MLRVFNRINYGGEGMARLAEMTVYNVQMGLAIHVKAPNGKYIVIDLGTGKAEDGNDSPIKKLRWANVGYMVITHPHMDHISDILSFNYADPSILRHCVGLTNQEVLDLAGDDKNALEKYQSYVDIVNRYTGSIEGNPSNPDVPSNYGGLEIKTFSAALCDHSNFNNFSVITVLKLGNIKVVVCGDNETESFDVLMNRQDFKDAVRGANILVAPHHGRESAYHSEFVNLVKPNLTIISDGKYQPFSASSMYSDASSGATVYDRNGNKETRFCVTTRNDGDMKVIFGETDDPKCIGTLYVDLI